MTKPHKHAELIKAWADGAEIQVWSQNTWTDVKIPYCFDYDYRIKPSPVTSYTAEELKDIYYADDGNAFESFVAVANAVIKRYIEDTQGE
jgi:hypothetical protein